MVRRYRFMASFFAFAFLICLVGLLPLQVALPALGVTQRGLAAREANGSIWLGRLREATLGPVLLGDLQLRLRLLPLLVGRARMDVATLDREDGLKGGLTATRHLFGVDDMSGRLDLGPAFAPLPATSLQLDDVTVHFSAQGCARADGAVTARTGGDLMGLPLPASLTGRIRCAGDALLLPLVSQGGTEGAAIRLYQDGRYRIELSVTQVDEAVAGMLQTAGFVRTANGYVLRADGKF